MQSGDVVFQGRKEGRKGCVARRPEIKAIYSKDFPRSVLATHEREYDEWSMRRSSVVRRETVHGSRAFSSRFLCSER